MRRSGSFAGWIQALAAASLLLAGCGGGGSSPALTRVEIEPNAPVVAKGLSVPLKVTAIYSDGLKEDVSRQIVWTTANAAVATVGNAETNRGRLVGMADGSTRVTATYGTVSATANVTVSAAAPTALSITPPSASLPRGTTQQLTATATLTDGTTQDVTSDATWTSSTTAVSVGNAAGSHGLARAVEGSGAATITAALPSGLSAIATVTATSAVVTRIDIDPATVSIAKGTSRQLTATAVMSDGSNRDITADADATWASEAATVAAVSDTAPTKGRVNALTTGTADITVSYKGQKGERTVAVTPAVIDRIEVTPSNPSGPKGSSGNLTATAVFSDASTQDVTEMADWTSSDPDIVSVSNAAGSSGRVSALNEGRSTISATYSGKTGSTLATVTAAVLSRIEVTPELATLPLGSARQFTATGVFTDGSRQAITTTVTWRSSDNSVVAISNADGNKGLAAASKAGSATITASSGAVSGSTTVTVSAAALAALQITPSNESVAKGFQLQLKATGRYTDSSVRDLTADVTWSTTDATIATVSNAAATRGLASGIGDGTVAISVQQSGVSATTFLTVTDATLESIEVSPAADLIPQGSQRQFTAIGTFSDSSTQDLTQQVTWASSNATVATVSNAAGSKGLANGIAAGGPVTVTASIGAVSDTANLTVSDAELVSISVTPPTTTVPKGRTQSFVATGTYTDGTSKDITAEVTWSSTATAFATVSNADGSEGVATGVAVGSATVRATSAAIAGQAVLTVSDAELTAIAVTPASATVAKGVARQFTATGTYSDASTRDITKEVAWTSSDEAVATVSNVTASAGGVATHAVGEATIAATSGALSDEALLTVTDAVLQRIDIEPAPAVLPAGTTLKLKAVGTYSDGSTQDLTATATWRSSNAGVAEVSNGAESRGLVFGRTAGAAQITATGASSVVVGTVNVTVNSALLQAIVITPANATLPVGFGRQYSATGQFSDGIDRDVTTQVSWSAINPSIVNVDNSAERKGYAQAVASGSTVIVAHLNGVSGTTPVTSAALALISIDVTPKNSDFVSGVVQFTATGAFSDSSLLNLTQQVTWSSSNTGVARISNADGSRGQATAGSGSTGTTTITARHDNVSGSTTLRRDP